MGFPALPAWTHCDFSIQCPTSISKGGKEAWCRWNSGYLGPAQRFGRNPISLLTRAPGPKPPSPGLRATLLVPQAPGAS